MIDWAVATSFEQAAKNVRSDSFGDWYRDPWGWPENEWVATKAPHILTARLNNRGAKRALPIDVPKENFILRPATLLDPIDRIAYQALVDSLSNDLIGSMRDFVFGWRLPFRNPTKGFYARNSSQWQGFRDALLDFGDSHQYGLATDITSFFQSVSIERLEQEVCQKVKRNSVIERLFDYLRSWDAIPSRGGLPQRCLASSVLAQFYLQPVDDVLALRSEKAHGLNAGQITSCRWMDDIWVFSDEWSALREVQLALQKCLWDVSLHLNGGKTQLREEDELRAAVREYEHSAADFGLLFDDSGPLEELVGLVLADPANSSRTTIRFITSRMRRYDLDIEIEGFVQTANRLPHGSDHLARLFRDLETWRELEEWYLEYLNGPSGKIIWSAYQLGTMFPSSEKSNAICDYFANGLSKGELPTVMLPLAAQRLAAWIPDIRKGLIQELARAGTYDHPFSLRALAFAGTQVGVPIGTVKTLLQQFDETLPQLALLESRAFKPLPVAEDFAGD